MVMPYLAQQTVTDYGHLQSDQKYSAKLAASTDTALLVPSDAKRYKAVIHYAPIADELWFAVNNTATVAAGAAFAFTNSELINLIGTTREVAGGDVLHFITPSPDISVSIMLYEVR